MQNKWRKIFFNDFSKGLDVFFLHKLLLQRGQKQKKWSLLQLMPLVVSVTATGTNCVAPDSVAVAAAQFWM